MCVLTVISDESVPSRPSELLLEVLFLLINESIHSSPALECGIVIITLATLNKRSNSQVFVPGFLKFFKNPHNLSTLQELSSQPPMKDGGISLSLDH